MSGFAAGDCVGRDLGECGDAVDVVGLDDFVADLVDDGGEFVGEIGAAAWLGEVVAGAGLGEQEVEERGSVGDEAVPEVGLLADQFVWVAALGELDDADVGGEAVLAADEAFGVEGVADGVDAASGGGLAGGVRVEGEEDVGRRGGR